MKTFLKLLLALGILLSAAHASAEDNLKIYIDDEMLKCEANPINRDGRVLVPMREIFEALGAEISWDGEGKNVWASRDGEFICVPVDGSVLSTGVHNSDGDSIWVDKIQLDVPAQIINDRTYVPVRAVSEALRANVSWDGAQNHVVINSRKNVDGVVYYASDSDYQKLYLVGKNGRGRRKISENSVCELEMYNGYVYYLSKDRKLLYRANESEGERLLIDKSINKIAIDNGYIYYQELDSMTRKSGILYRYHISDGIIERLTDNSVQYPVKYRDYIYFNLSNDNSLYSVNIDGTKVNVMNIGDADEKLYPFNCMFFGDYIFIENGAWYGNLTRMNLDGSNVRTLTQSNSLICRKQIPSDRIVYIRPDGGQHLYSMNIDGTDERIIHESDSSWIDLEVLAQCGNTLYYKNPMRGEVYRVNLDGSEDTYVCYADDVKVFDERLFASYEGLYMGSLDASDLTNIYDRAVKDFTVKGKTVYITDALSSKLYMTDFYGIKCALTADSVGEWVCE